jgi:general secretion pathway protein M
MDQANSFQAFRQQWQARWAAFAPRERQLFSAAAWLIGLTLLVLVGIRPAWRTLSDTPTQLREIGTQLDHMRSLAEEAQALRNRPPVPPAQAEAALKSATDRLGKGAQLALQGDRATIALNNIAGRELATWLEEVRAGARVRPLEAQLTQVEPGVYSGSITVALAPGAAPR